MAIELRCMCGQLVYADERHAGKHVQCPHCRASVAVPIATASAVPPKEPTWNAPTRKPILDSSTRFTLQMVTYVLLSAAFFGILKGCKEDLKKPRPSPKEVIRKSPDNRY